ncbi:helix-turn-helix domain-containing protein [Bizionia argentinensis JUB59]|uniref:Helix-turn-helix domain-containing protein n=1 Tax=Bizionia argentinensis JUB59 TaxID=1046627 RepID=G2EAN0_9FLAO|nr:AraC family transcriptional regulator [Bizionia argentinensis]EGV44492.1 helix-turn-helix domain-containing protein [Bizionia argentinensis JUB59]
MRFYLFIIFLLPFILYSQNEESLKELDSVFYNITVNIAASNPSKAIHLADSIHLNSKNVKQKLSTHMFLADILEKQDMRGEAIGHALEALEIAEAEGDYNFQSRIYGFLSSQYRIIGFLDTGKDYLEKGIEASANISDKKQALKRQGQSNQELAEYALDENDYYKAIKLLEVAIASFEAEEPSQFKYFSIGNAEQMMGRAFMALEDNTKALEHFSKAEVFLNKADAGSSLCAGTVYYSLGKTYLRLNNNEIAKVYLKKALVISENSNNGSLKENVYKNLGNYYLQKQELDHYMAYDSKYLDVLNKNSAQDKSMINSAYKALNENSKKATSNNYFYIIIGGLILLLIGFGAYHKRKAGNSMYGNDHEIKRDHDINLNKSREFLLSKEKEQELLQKLEEFEVSNNFLNNNMSLSTLVGELNTNAKYLRQVLKRNKNTDYNDYINKLRIQYIVDKLKTDPEYLNYKISYLAEECGFSSHSKFSASFKHFVNTPPSKFIGKLNHNKAS